ncbi:MAG: hypothetical protein R3D26_23830 [Cyanobacteriota/Melainabacteria group bacterium]
MLAYLQRSALIRFTENGKRLINTWLTSSRDFQQELVEQPLPVTESTNSGAHHSEWKLKH